MQNTDTGSG